MKVTPNDEAEYLNTEEGRQGYLDNCSEFELDMERANEAVSRSRKIHGDSKSSILSFVEYVKAKMQNLH